MAASNPITVPLPADLPTTWQLNQIVAPDGAYAGLSEQYGYNYLMEQVNAAQQALQQVGAYFPQLAALADVGVCQILQINIPQTAWTPSEDPEFYYTAQIAVPDAQESYYPLVTIQPDSLQAAFVAGLSPTVQTADGTLTFWARNQPSQNLLATVMLQSQSNGSGGGGGGGSYTLPPATQSTLGGVIVGDGVSVTPEGLISVQQADADAVRQAVVNAFL